MAAWENNFWKTKNNFSFFPLKCNWPSRASSLKITLAAIFDMVIQYLVRPPYLSLFSQTFLSWLWNWMSIQSPILRFYLVPYIYKQTKIFRKSYFCCTVNYFTQEDDTSLMTLSKHTKRSKLSKQAGYFWISHAIINVSLLSRVFPVLFLSSHFFYSKIIYQSGA